MLNMLGQTADLAPVAIFLLLVGSALLVGRFLEQRHFHSLRIREEENADFMVSQLRSYPGAVAGAAPPTMFCGEAVISSDYLKTMLASLRKIFGGELRSYRSLLERARREALQRVVEQAKARGYNAVCNVRFETSDIGGAGNRRRGVVMVSILASATAYHCRLPDNAV